MHKNEQIVSEILSNHLKKNRSQSNLCHKLELSNPYIFAT